MITVPLTLDLLRGALASPPCRASSTRSAPGTGGRPRRRRPRRARAPSDARPASSSSPSAAGPLACPSSAIAAPCHGRGSGSAARRRRRRLRPFEADADGGDVLSHAGAVRGRVAALEGAQQPLVPCPRLEVEQRGRAGREKSRHPAAVQLAVEPRSRSLSWSCCDSPLPNRALRRSDPVLRGLPRLLRFA